MSAMEELELPSNPCPEANLNGFNFQVGKSRRPPQEQVHPPRCGCVSCADCTGQCQNASEPCIFPGGGRSRSRSRTPSAGQQYERSHQGEGREGVCRLHPRSCRCEQCPCPELAGTYTKYHIYRGRPSLGPTLWQPKPRPIQIRNVSRQAGVPPRRGDGGRLLLGRPPTIFRQVPEPILMLRAVRQAGRYPNKGAMVFGPSPVLCWRMAETGLRLPPGCCPDNMVRPPCFLDDAQPMTTPDEDEDEEQPADLERDRPRFPRTVTRVDSHTCTFPTPASADRPADLSCRTCEHAKELEVLVASKSKKKKKDVEESTEAPGAEAPEIQPVELPTITVNMDDPEGGPGPDAGPTEGAGEGEGEGEGDGELGLEALGALGAADVTESAVAHATSSTAALTAMNAIDVDPMKASITALLGTSTDDIQTSHASGSGGAGGSVSAMGPSLGRLEEGGSGGDPSVRESLQDAPKLEAPLEPAPADVAPDEETEPASDPGPDPGPGSGPEEDVPEVPEVPEVPDEGAPEGEEGASAADDQAAEGTAGAALEKPNSSKKGQGEDEEEGQEKEPGPDGEGEPTS